jgi:phosphate/sulfate permease
MDRSRTIAISIQFSTSAIRKRYTAVSDSDLRIRTSFQDSTQIDYDPLTEKGSSSVTSDTTPAKPIGRVRDDLGRLGDTVFNLPLIQVRQLIRPVPEEPRAAQVFKVLQPLSASFLSFTHGSNDTA